VTSPGPPDALSSWDLAIRSARAINTGWNSATWEIRCRDGQRYVAKLVDPDSEGFPAGMRVAAWLGDQGFRSGRPVPLPDGSLVRLTPDGYLAVLEWLDGRHPDLAAAPDARRAGRLLARAHRLLAACPVEASPRFSWPWAWVDEALDRTPLPQAPAALVRRAWRDVVRLVADAGLTVSLVHADPGPAGMLLGDAPERDGLIDWTTALRGPLVYDLAALAMSAQTPDAAALTAMVDGYLDVNPSLRPELRHLDDVRAARWVADALYFAHRIDRGITRGGPPLANRDGLDRACRALLAWY
jgi:homoserine kinase type II